MNAPRRNARIAATGMYVPERVVPNAWFDEQLGENVSTWLQEHLTIRERRWAAPDESTADLVEAAARDILARAQVEAASLDLIVVATDTPEYVSPSTAVNLHANFYRTPPEAEFMITDRIQIRGASDFEAYAYAVSRNVGAMLDEPTSDWLDAITQPTLIVFGENDGLIPNPYLHGGRTESVAEIGVDAIAGSALLMVPECGHFVQFECPDVVNPAVAAFLNR